MSANWTPSDDDLDGLARSLSTPSRDADRVEQQRTALLTRTATMTQVRATSRVPWAIAATALAAAATIVLWVGVRPDPRIESITALGPAHYERVSPWPDFAVRLDEGRVQIVVGRLRPRDDLHIATSDAGIEARDGTFVVEATDGHLRSVVVARGRAEVHWAHESVVVLGAGESWSPPITAQREELTAPPAPPLPSVNDDAPATISTPAPVRTATPTEPAPRLSSRPTTPVTSAVVTARPGEAEFRAGIAALRTGDAAAAVSSFATACKVANRDALGEDACFWVGAAANRAHQIAIARDALTEFLSRYPRSARAGEASALLGWILYDADELDEARSRFTAAANDRVAKVKESAQRGLEAIRRTSGAPTP